jgi:hypothetical protein
MRLLLFSSLIVIIIGCGTKATKPVNESLIAELRLTDTLGRPTTTFHTGENLIFSYIVTNRTGRTLNVDEHSPFGVFEVYSKDGLVNLVFDWRNLSMAIIRIAPTLPDGHSLIFTAGWPVKHPEYALPVGTYTLFAKPNVSLESFGALSDKTIDFEVVP